MQRVMNLVAERKSRLAEHPFLTSYMCDEGVPLDTKFHFAPIMTNFVMNFRDINKWFLRFENPANEMQETINGNTYEDETHSRLFLEDWKKLNLDGHLGWKASDTIWWLFLAEETEPFRGFGMRFSRMSVADGGDVLVRFAHSEAGEACGNCFFEVVAPKAQELCIKNSINYRYFGHFHLDREKGHVIDSEGMFETLPLTDSQAALSLELADKMFDIFFEMFDCFDSYARKYAATGRIPRRVKAPPSKAPVGTKSETAPPQRAVDSALPTYQAEVQTLLEERKAKTAAHPFYAWLREDNGVSPKNKLQRFMPMWVMDIMGYRDLNHYCLRYPTPANAEERAINQWVDSLSTHSVLFLNDWDALQMDEIVNWTASETLKFLFLDPQMDVHRHNAATFIKLAMTHVNPMRRFWMMEALEASGESFFLNTRRLAYEVEAQTGIRLDYFADRHDVVHPEGAVDPKAMALAFKKEEMTAEDRDVAVALVNTVFDAVDAQLTLSLEVARTNKFGVRAAGTAASADSATVSA